MFNERVSRVKSLTVVGKLLTLLVISPAIAGPLDSPRFFEYNNGGSLSRAVNISFGWFNTLDSEQEDAYQSSIIHALEYSENGETVRWYKNDASGRSTPTATWPSASGFCRRIHIQAIAFGVEKTKGVTACYNNTTSNWTWHTDKY